MSPRVMLYIQEQGFQGWMDSLVSRRLAGSSAEAAGGPASGGSKETRVATREESGVLGFPRDVRALREKLSQASLLGSGANL